jgi:multicomponent Na+:H+ antiporter subunit B
MSSLILRTATRFLMPLLLLFSLFLLLRGHNEPGGGFVGGLHTISAGVPASRRALLIHPSTLLSVGLLVALASAVPALIVGRPFMSALWTEVGTGKAAWAIGTPLVFDVGVFLAVIGVVLTIVFTLAED